MRNSGATAPPPGMYGSYAAPPASSAGYAKIPTYPAPPSSYPNPSPVPPAAAPSPSTPIQDPTAPPSSLAKAAELVTRFQEHGQTLIAACRPWGEVFRTPAFSRPPNLGEAVARMRRNTAYFRSNYEIGRAHV